MGTRKFALGLALASAGNACGGESRQAKDPEPSASSTQSSTAGGSQNASNGASDDSASSNSTTTGVGGQTATSACSGPPRLCVEDCGSSELVMQDTCQSGAWRCPDAYVLWSDCPPDSCTMSEVSCCNDETGVIVSAPCGPDDKPGSCPGDTRKLGPDYDCIPSKSGVSDCNELSGPCASETLRCVSGGGPSCGTLCACESDASGKLAWICQFVTCP